MSYPTPPPDTSVKVAHLVFGMLFLGFAGVWALVAGGAIDVDRVAVLGPGLLILAGVVGLVASMAGSRNRRRRLHQLDEQAHDDQAQDDRLDLFHDDEDRTEEIR